MKKFSLFPLLLLFISCANASDLRTVDSVDLDLYMGEWFEIARYENSFQKNCLATRVTYSLKKQRVKVLNECKDKKGLLNSARGTARVVDTETNAKLKVSFVPFFQRFGLFSGDYWIIELDPEYNYAVVGHPERKFLWILSRNPSLSENDYSYLLKKIEDNGYDITKLQKTPRWDN